MSSVRDPPTIERGGLFSTDPIINPDFFNAHVVYVRYCSSDAFSGTNGRGHGWVFRGQRILEAVLKETVLRSLSSSESSSYEILFSGCSSGAQGVLNSLPWVIESLRSSSIGPLITRVKALADAGWMMDIPPLVPGHISSGEQFRRGVGLWRPKRISLECVQSNPCHIDRCFLSPFLFPYLAAPSSNLSIMVQSSQYDAFQLPWDCCSPPFHPSEAGFARKIRDAFFYSLHSLVHPPSAVFSPSCFTHCLTEDSDLFTGVRVEGLSLRDALHWWFLEDRETLLLSDCGEVGCSQGCPPL